MSPKKQWRSMALGFVLVLLSVELGARFVGPRTRLDVDVLGTLLTDHREQTEALTVLSSNGERQIDVAVIGSSTAGAGVDAAVLARVVDPADPTGYTAWVPGANASVLELAATEMLPALVKPSTVVLAVTSRELNDSYDIGEFEVGLLPDNLKSSLAWRRISEKDALATRFEAGASDLSGLIRYRIKLREPTSWISWITSDDEGDLWDLTETGRLRTYVENTAPLEASESHLAREERVLNNYRAGGAQTDALARALEDLSSQGARVMLVFLPTSKSTFYPLHPNGASDVERARDAAKDASDRASVEFLDLSDLGDDDAWFGDSNHLNGVGSAAVSEIIADALR